MTSTDLDSLPSGRSRIPELSGIEFTGAESIREYVNALRALCRDLSCELEFAAGELNEVLKQQSGHPLLMGIDTRMRARRVSRRLERASMLAGAGAVEAVGLWMEFRRQFADVIRDRKGRKDPRSFNWEGK